ncbi:MAG TPA: hypothetical protein VGO46_19330 [Gemmatimonadaceae bacterium]|nr:hypothetical protein [Gemmatimonadaceae bacterium]
MTSRMRPVIIAAFAGAMSFSCAHPHSSPMQSAPSSGAPTPDSLATLFLQRFAADSPAAFDSIDPDSESRTVMHSAVKRKMAREAGLGRVVWRDSEHAVLLLTGTVKADNGGDEANLVRHFSGLYEARANGGVWSVVRQLPIDSLNYIRRQVLHVELTPGKGIVVNDTMGIAIGGRWGFAARLNNDVKVSRLRLDGDSTTWAFAGGVLWIGASRRAHAQLVLDYTLRDANAPAKDSVLADSVLASGAYHNTDVWHPVFSYTSANNMAVMSLTVRLPATYHLSTTLPQTETVANGVRTVTGTSTYPAWLLSLIYDRDWQVVTSKVNGVTFETFLTPSFHFQHDTLASALRRIDSVFSKSFGGPTPPYIAVVEDRFLGARGFSVRMTDAVITGTKAEHLDLGGIQGPVAAFAHEISHGWTMNATGPAANMLREGWATFAEVMAVGAAHGAQDEADFWDRLRNGYMLGSEGRLSILGNPDNGGVHYSKGSWIFRMYDLMLGDSAFDRGIRSYVQRQADGKPAGYRELIASMSQAGGRDLTSFSMPWFTQKVIPDVRAEIAGDRVIVTQMQATPPFDLPLELAIVTASGKTIRRTLHLTSHADTLRVVGVDSMTAVQVDPDHHLLLQRHWGERAHFELPVDQARDAKSVALVGDFSLTAVPATRVSDRWVVDLPLSDGRYVWTWQLDGKPRAPGEGGDAGTEGIPSLTGMRYVKPLQFLPDAYPKVN